MKYILAIVVLGGVGFVLLMLLNQPRVEEARAYREMGLALQQQALVAQEAVAVTGQAVAVTGQAVRGLVWVAVGLVVTQLVLLLATVPRRRRRRHSSAISGRPALPSPNSVQPFDWKKWENRPWEL